MIVRSAYPDVEIPDLPLTGFVLEHAVERGDKPALVDGPSGRTLSYASLVDSVRRMAGGLARHGVRQGDVVGLFAPNMPEWAVAFHGIASIGAVVTTINSLATPEEIEHRSLLFRLVDRLPVDQRRVILMRFAEQKTIREIAQELARSEGAVKQLQLRGLQNLRARLGDRNG